MVDSPLPCEVSKNDAYFCSRDSEDSAPAEFPPEQPEADVVEDDGATYGAEEAELEAALIQEEAALGPEDADEEMGGADDTAGAPGAVAKADDDDDSDAGSEDLEAESSGSEDEDIEDEEGEGEGDEDMEMGEDGEAKTAAPQETHNGPSIAEAAHGEVMVH